MGFPWKAWRTWFSFGVVAGGIAFANNGSALLERVFRLFNPPPFAAGEQIEVELHPLILGSKIAHLNDGWHVGGSVHNTTNKVRTLMSVDVSTLNGDGVVTGNSMGAFDGDKYLMVAAERPFVASLKLPERPCLVRLIAKFEDIPPVETVYAVRGGVEYMTLLDASPVALKVPGAAANECK